MILMGPLKEVVLMALREGGHLLPGRQVVTHRFRTRKNHHCGWVTMMTQFVGSFVDEP